MNIQQSKTQVQDTPQKTFISRRKKATIIAVVSALLIAGGGGTAYAVTEKNRTNAYDEQVEKANELIDSIKTLEATIPQAKYVFVEANQTFEKQHFSEMKTIGKANKKLVTKETLKPVTEAVKVLSVVYGEDAEEQVTSEEEQEHYKLWGNTFDKEQSLEALLDLQESVEVVAPPALSTEFSGRPSQEQIDEAENAVIVNTEIHEELQAELDKYESAFDDLDTEVLSHGELLVEPAMEALENAKSYVKDWDKASKKSKKNLKTATSNFEQALEDYQSGETHQDESADTPTGDEEVTESIIDDVLTFSHISADEMGVELASDLRSAFVKFLKANSNVKKSHEEAVKKAKAKAGAEAAAQAAANAGASTYQNPQTGAWEQTPGYSNGGGGSTGGGGGWSQPPANGGGGSAGGGGGTSPSTGGGGGSGGSTSGGGSTGGGGYTCPGLKPGYQWSSSTHTINGVTCQNQTPLGGDADEW